MKKAIVFLLSLCFIIVNTLIVYSETLFYDKSDLKINEISYSKSAVPLYGLFEITVNLTASYNNPFNSEDILLTGHFTSPSGLKNDIRGFYYQDYDRTVSNGREDLNPKGKPLWKIRFAPKETGSYKFYIDVKDGGNSVKSEVFNFKVVKSDNPGFISIDKNSNYLKFNSNIPYFAVGESIAWGNSANKIGDYEYYFDKLAKNGCNYSRIWLVDWNLPLEWTDNGKTNGKVYGPGKYSENNSWKLDYILELARKKGIYILLTLDTYGSIAEGTGVWNEHKWSDNPYNIKNGGPCNTPQDYWTNPEAKRLYKQRLDYIISRWGYSPNILAFELWSEVNTPPDWTEEMSAYLKAKDANKHLVTISLGYPWEEANTFDSSKIWNIDNIDYTQIHLYGNSQNNIDIEGEVYRAAVDMIKKYDKPHIAAEFGLDPLSDDAKYDTKGIGTHLHNTLWTSLMSGAFGTAMTHWKEYVDANNLYYMFKAPAAFSKAVNWTAGKWNKAETELINYDAGSKGSSDLTLQASGGWGEDGEENITINGDGSVEGKPNKFIHGMARANDLRIEPKFNVNYAENGSFILNFDSVSKDAQIEIYVDDKMVWNKKFNASSDPAKWETRTLADDEKKVSIPINKGRHVIRVANKGSDWIKLNNITLTHYYKDTPLRTVGLYRNDEAMLWIQNKESSWVNTYSGKEVKPVNNISMELTGLDDGKYTIEWWNTITGTVERRASSVSKNKTMLLKISSLKSDTACRIYKSRSAADTGSNNVSGRSDWKFSLIAFAGIILLLITLGFVKYYSYSNKNKKAQR